MDRPKRKRLRLPHFDYSSPGAYFVTICTRDRRCILSDITVGALHEAPEAHVQLTPIGLIVQAVIEALPSRYPDLAVVHFVIMPNHIHLLLQINEASLRANQSRSLLAQAIGFLKMNSSRRIHQKYPDLVIWQRSYHEHVIRNEKDYQEIWNYIEGNPSKWAEDRYHPV